MDEKQYLDTQVDLVVLNEVIKGSHSTKYVKKYSIETRIIIYKLRNYHGLSYRKIIEYCEYKYDISPSVGHVKQLILDGEEALKGINKKDAIVSSNKIIQKDITINNQCETTMKSTESEKERKLKRKIELILKEKHTDLTIEEFRELWGTGL